MSEEKKLNKEQIEAIEYGDGPLLIIAGAGTGKTTVVSERIVNLIINKKINPSEILALTFTEKATREMQERVDIALPLSYANMWIMTFHSFADRILKDEAINIGLSPQYRLMTQTESIQFFKKNIFNFNLDYFRPLGNPNKFVEGILQHFSRLKDEDVEPNQYLDWVEDQRSKIKDQSEAEEIKKNEELARVYMEYEELKIKEGLMDFGDLISNVIKLFRLRPNVLRQYREMFKYVLVDEFQDTNYSQYVLIKMLAPPPDSNLTVVGDDNQSIYKFRGAAISNILQFIEEYSKTKNIVLNKNYRSSQTILDTSYKLIKNNDPDSLEAKMGIDKKLIKNRKVEESLVEFIMSDRVENEADRVAAEIVKLSNSPIVNCNGKYDYKDFAILLRANSHAEPFVRALEQKGIPFQFLGPGMLFKQPEVKDLIAYLSILANISDSVSMYRLLSMDIFNISGRELAVISLFAKKNNLSIFEACEKIDQISASPEVKNKISALMEMIYRHMDLLKNQTAGQILYFFLKESGLLKSIINFNNVDDEKKANNISKFFDKIKSFENNNEDSSIQTVMDYIKLSMDLGESPLAADTDWTENNAVNILTVHSSKGLEFPVVFLVNLVSQRFPTTQRSEQIPMPQELIKEILPVGDFHIEEERRLFYVGMTRAKDILYLTASNYYGEGKREKKISPFVIESLGKEYVDNLLNIVAEKKVKQLSFLDYDLEINKEVKEYDKNINNKINFLSYSQIESFNTCPLQYKYKSIIKIPAPSSFSLSFGSIVHETMRDFYQKFIAGQKVSKDGLLEILRENWSSQGFLSKKQEEDYIKEGIKIMSEYFDKSFDGKTKVLSLEQNFNVRISPELKMGGKIDRIDQTQNGIEIIDYKTGKSTTKKDVEKDLQLSLYALSAVDGTLTFMGLLPQIPKPEEVKVSFYFFDNQEKVTTTRTKENFDLLKKELVEKAKEIEKSDLSPTPGQHCNFCEYKMICEAWS